MKKKKKIRETSLCQNAHSHIHVNFLIPFQRADRHLESHPWIPKYEPLLYLRKQFLYSEENYMGTMLFFKESKMDIRL